MQKIRNFPAGYPVRLTLHSLLLCLTVSVFGQTSTDVPADVAKKSDDTVATAVVDQTRDDSAAPDASDQKNEDTVEENGPAESNTPETFGWIEKVILSPELRWNLDAKLDTGADTSSLDAIKIRRVRFKGKRYVRFSIRNPESGEMISLRRPYVRTVRIRRHSGDHQRRYVALMTVCLGTAERTIEVTLTDREYFDYPMLLGRRALAGLAVVDSSATYTTEPDCRTQFSQEPEIVEEKPLKATEEPSSKPAKEASPKPVEEASPKPVEEASPKPVEEASPKPAEEASSVGDSLNSEQHVRT